MKQKKLLHRLTLVAIFLFFLIPTLVLTPKLLLKDPPIWPDETYFVNVAQNLLKSGHLSMTLYRTEGIGHPEIRAYSYPPLYFYLLVGWIKMFGNSIQAVRLLSVLFGVGSLGLAFILVYKKTNHLLLSGLGMLALELFPPFSGGMHIARMEILILFFLLLSLYCIEHPRGRFMFGAGICASLALLLHPIGIIVPVVLFVEICFKKESLSIKVRDLNLVGILLAGGLLLWGIQITDHFNLFILQMRIQFLYKENREALINLLFERDLYWRILLLFFLMVSSGIFVYGWISKKFEYVKNAIFFFLTLLIIMISKDQWYLIFLPIFPLLSSSSFAVKWFSSKNRYRFVFLVPFMVIFMLYTFQGITQIRSSLKKNEDYTVFVQGVEKQLPKNSTVVLSMVPDPYFELQQRNDLTIYQVPHVTEPGKLNILLGHSDILLYNYATNPELTDYLKTHTEKKFSITQANGYQVDMIFFKK